MYNPATGFYLDALRGLVVIIVGNRLLIGCLEFSLNASRKLVLN